LESKTIANVKAELQEVEEDIAYDQQRRRDLLDELWDLENPANPGPQTVEDAIDSE
jgi:hypothetical protein